MGTFEIPKGERRDTCEAIPATSDTSGATAGRDRQWQRGGMEYAPIRETGGSARMVDGYTRLPAGPRWQTVRIDFAGSTPAVATERGEAGMRSQSKTLAWQPGETGTFIFSHRRRRTPMNGFNLTRRSTTSTRWGSVMVGRLDRSTSTRAATDCGMGFFVRSQRECASWLRSEVGIASALKMQMRKVCSADREVHLPISLAYRRRFESCRSLFQASVQPRPHDITRLSCRFVAGNVAGGGRGFFTTVLRRTDHGA